MSARVIREGAENLSEALDFIFKESLRTSELPEDWSMANVTPVFKKGCRDDIENYRGVSLTSIICRLLERIMKDSILKCLGEYNIIGNTQHGFLRNKSCLTNLLEYVTL